MSVGVVHVFDGRGADWRVAAGLASRMQPGDVVLSSADELSRAALGRAGVPVSAWMSVQRDGVRGLANAVAKAMGGRAMVTAWGSAERMGRAAGWNGHVNVGDVSRAAASEAERWRAARDAVRRALEVQDGEAVVGFGGRLGVDAGRVARGTGILQISGRQCIGLMVDDETAGVATRSEMRGIQFGEDHAYPWRILTIGAPLGLAYSAMDLLVWLADDARSPRVGGPVPPEWELAREMGIRVIADLAYGELASGVDGVETAQLWPAVALASGTEAALAV